MKNKNTSNDGLYNDAMEAITVLFSDETVSQSTCKLNLQNLIEEIQVMIDSLEDEP